MDKANWSSPGQQDITRNEFAFEQAAIRRAMFGFFTALGVTEPESFILSGCEITPGTPNNVAAGFIVLGGEICEVDAHTYAAPSIGQTSYWAIQQTVDPAGNATSGSNSYSRFLKRRAKVVNGSITPGTKFLDTDTMTWNEKLLQKSPRQETIVEIGDWNMQSTANKTVAHGLTLTNRIITDIKVIVYNDDDLATREAPTPFQHVNKGFVTNADGTNVYIGREAGSSFISTDWNATGISRGTVTITHEPKTRNY